MKSILQDKKECYFSGATHGIIELHHIYYGGGLRQVSDDNGFTCYLLKQFHTGYYTGDTRAIHQGNSELDLWLKQACQREYEKQHSRAEFIKLIGRNYLEE